MASEDNTMLPLPEGSGKRPERLLPDDFWMFEYKVLMCPKRENHDWERCIYAHRGERARRRHPSKYQAVQCPEARAKKVCPRGEACPCTHHLFEYWLHPDRYLTCLCELGPTCNRPICFFAHERNELRPLPAGLVSASELNPGQAWQQLSTPSSRASTPPATASSASNSPPPRQGSSPMSISTAMGAGSIGSGQAAFSALDLLTGDDTAAAAAGVQRAALPGSVGMAAVSVMPRPAGAALLGGASLSGSCAGQGGGFRTQGNQRQLQAGGGMGSTGGGVWVPELGGNSGNMLPVIEPVKIIRSMSDGYTPSGVLQQQQQQQQQQQALAAAGLGNSNCSSPLGLTAMFQPECAAFAKPAGPTTSAGRAISPKSAANTLELLSLGGTAFDQSVLSVGLTRQPSMAAGSMATASQQLRQQQQQQQQQAVNGYALINSAAMDPQILSMQQLVDETQEHLSFSLWELGDQQQQQQQQIFQQQLQQQLQLQQLQQQPQLATGQVLGMPTAAAGSAVAGSYSPPAAASGQGLRMALAHAGNHSGGFSGFQPWSATGELSPAHAVSDRSGSFTGQPGTFGSPGGSARVAGAAAGGVPVQTVDMFDMQQRGAVLLQQSGMMAGQQQQQQVAVGQGHGHGQGDSWWPIMAQQQQQQQQQHQQLLNKLSPSSSWTFEEPAIRQQQQPAGGKRDKGSKSLPGGPPGVLAAALMSQVQELLMRKKSGSATGAEGRGAGTTAASPALSSLAGSGGGSSRQPATDSAAATASSSAAASSSLSSSSTAVLGGGSSGTRHSLLSAWLDKASSSASPGSGARGEKGSADKMAASVESARGPSAGAAPLPEEVVSVLAQDVLGLLSPADVAHLVELLQSGLQKRSLSAPAPAPAAAAAAAASDGGGPASSTLGGDPGLLDCLDQPAAAVPSPQLP